MRRCDWEWKYLGESRYLVLCAECGREDSIQPTEEDADRRRAELRATKAAAFGFNRRARLARKARR